MSDADREIIEQMHLKALENGPQPRVSPKGPEIDLSAKMLEGNSDNPPHRRNRNDPDHEFIVQMHRKALENIPEWVFLPQKPHTIHYTELPVGDPASPGYQEWNTYRREVGRLLAEGHADKYVLIKGDAIIGLWDSQRQAIQAGYERFPGQPFVARQVLERELVLRLSSRIWQNTPIPSKQAS